MLKLNIEAQELFDEASQTFKSQSAFVLELEHSLVSVSKWESDHEKPFLIDTAKSGQEMLDYVIAMIVTPEYPSNVAALLSVENFVTVQNYINSKQSATTFGELPKPRGKGETITAELIYYWMVAFNIPFECERWHLNRLFSLIRIANIKNSKQSGKSKRLNQSDLEARRALNEQRRRQLGTAG